MKSSAGIYSGKMITVGIVEDDAGVRESIRDYCNLQPDLCCDLAEESAEQFLARLTDEQVPDVVLMDIGLPGMSGIDAIRLLKERHPDVDVIMLTVYHDPQTIFQSLCAGASGYLLKTTPFLELQAAIRDVHAGGAPMSAQIARKVVDYFHPEAAVGSEQILTAREKEVIFGLVDGLSYKMIAGRLSVTVETVRSHIKSIYRKLQVHSKAEVISRSLKGEI